MDRDHTNDLEKVRSLPTNQKIFTSLFAGACAGGVAKTTIAPLDRAKINFQVHKSRFTYKALANFLKSDIEQNGVRNLWRGNSATMVRVMPSAAINFTSHEQYKRLLHVDEDSSSPTPFRRFLAGSLAGLTASCFTYPLDLARARMAVTSKIQFNNLIEIFVVTRKTEGILGLYKGFSLTILGALPYAGNSYFFYESLKIFHKKKYKSEPAAFERMMYGAVAGAIGQTSSYPFDVLRRRMQTARVINLPEASLTARQLFVKILKEEGLFKGLYKGLSLNWIKGPVAAGVGFMTYDVLQIFTRKFLVFYY